MASRHEDDLICDFAEYYHVYDWRALPLETAAALASGLPESSRVMREISGTKTSTEVMLLAAIADRLSLLLWAQTKDGQKGINRPDMITDKLTGDDEKDGVRAFVSGEAFRAAWNARNERKE